ncbi:ABC transporter permease subunit [Roseomonas stagni]|uniref:ABC transporter permease subunit n=1 Tax=Falsiroseomonas algicola TaxID=2716930 RepID=A0A6M1LHZ4_9PROT|nr:ABC transporter permease subunit [Falsiroseomonas algicola]NGM19787.1 ABC transporter permease subunit [Falsiroseomonas algicola]
MLPYLLLAPALFVVGAFFLVPLAFSVGGAFEGPQGPTLANLANAASLYRMDLLFTLLIVVASTALTGLGAVAIGGYLTLGRSKLALRLLGAMYRWPLFIPFIVAAQAMRGFIGQNGLMNNTLVWIGLMPQEWAQSFLDWRGIVITFVWKQLPFATLLVAGAMAALDRSGIEAAQNLGANRLRILIGIVIPQVARNIMVALVLSFVTMMSVLSVPMMISGQSPTMLTVAMAWRINSFGDYGTANALGLVSCVMTGLVAWVWLRQAAAERAR